MALVYVLTELPIPGMGTITHLAELEEINRRSARMRRLIQIDGGVATGLWERGAALGEVAVPADLVPHPDTYADFPDISARRISGEDFEGHWLAARERLVKR